MRLAHPSVRLSICLSVRPSVPYGLVIREQKNVEKLKLVYTFHRARKWSANFQLKRSKVKVTGCQKPPQQSGVHVYLRVADRAWWLGRTEQTRRRNLLSAPGTLGNWRYGRISCRHSTPTSFLVLSNVHFVKFN